MQFLIQNVTNHETKESIDKSLKEVLIDKKVSGKTIQGEVHQNNGAYLIVSNLITDNQILIDLIRDLKNQFNLYIRNTDFNGLLKVFTLTNYKSPKVQVTKELVKELNEGMSNPKKKLGMKKYDIPQLLKLIGPEGSIKVKNEGKTFGLAEFNGEKILVKIHKDSVLNITGKSFWTDSEIIKGRMEKEGYQYDDSLAN